MADGLDINLRADVEQEPRGAPRPSRSPLGTFIEFLRYWGTPVLALLVVRSIVVEPFQIPSGSMVPTLAIGDFIAVSKFAYGLRVPFTDIELVPLGEPERGDIMVFIYPPSQSKDPWCTPKHLAHWMSFGVVDGPEECSIDYVKRLVGMPGDTVELHDGVVYINGAAQVRTADGSFDYVSEGCDEVVFHKWTEQLGPVRHATLTGDTPVSWQREFGPVTVPEGHYFMMGDDRDNSEDSRVWGFVPRANIKGKATYVWLSVNNCAPGGGTSFRLDRVGLGLE